MKIKTKSHLENIFRNYGSSFCSLNFHSDSNGIITFWLFCEYFIWFQCLPQMLLLIDAHHSKSIIQLTCIQNHKMKLEEVEKICPFCGEVFSQSIIHEHISSNHLGLDFWNDSGSQPCPMPKIKREATRSTPKRAIGKILN